MAGDRPSDEASRALLGRALDRTIFQSHTEDAALSPSVRCIRDVAAVAPPSDLEQLNEMRSRLRAGVRGALDDIREWAAQRVLFLIESDQDELEQWESQMRAIRQTRLERMMQRADELLHSRRFASELFIWAMGVTVVAFTVALFLISRYWK